MIGEVLVQPKRDSYKSWGDNDEIADLPDEHLRVFQIPASQASNQATRGKNNSINSSNGRWETCIIIMLLKCNNQTFGSPLVLRLARDVTGKITLKTTNDTILIRLRFHVTRNVQIHLNQ